MHRPTASQRRRAHSILGLTAGLLSLMGASPARAQLPSGMASTWNRFQSAVRANDPEAVARISRFPLQSNEFGGPIPNLAQLRQRFTLIFSAGRRQCLLNQTPTLQRVDGQEFFEAFCETDRVPIRFLFERISGDYRWTAIDNINE